MSCGRRSPSSSGWWPTRAAAAAATGARIQTGIEGQRQQAVARAKYVNPPPMTAPMYFQDRHVETELLATFLRAEISLSKTRV
jgi:hypothetical protein